MDGNLQPGICELYENIHGESAGDGGDSGRNPEPDSNAPDGEDEPEVLPSGMCDNKDDKKNAEDAAEAVVAALQRFNVDYREPISLFP